MKNRILASVLVLLLLAMSLVALGCPAEEDPAVVPAPEPEVIRWIAQSEDPPILSTFLNFQAANEAIYIASGGRFIIETHPGGAIVPADAELMPVHMGALDAASIHSVHWTGKFPAAPLFSFKIGGPTAMEHFFWLKEGGGLELLNEMFADAGLNVKAVAAVARDPEVFLYTRDRLRTVEDMRGLKLRVLGDEALIFAKLGVAGLPIPSGEIYESMRLGVIDGFQHVTFAQDWAMGFHEVTNYVWVSPVRQPTCAFKVIVNKGSWAALPPDLQRLAQEIWWSYGIGYLAYWSGKQAEARTWWEDFGVTVEPLPREIEDAVLAAAKEFHAARAAECAFYARVLESLVNWTALFRPMRPL